MASLTALPNELTSAIFTALADSHECPACAQNDLYALTLVSRSVSAVATKHLYSSITLRPHDAATYESRISALEATLSSRPDLGSAVRRLRFSHEHTEITRKHWASVVAYTPGLAVLQGVDTFFPESETDEEHESDGTLDGRVGALCALPSLSQAVIHHEAMPCAPSHLLRSWPSLKTLVVGNISPSYEYTDSEGEDVVCTIGDLASGLRECKKLRNVYFHDCDLDWESKAERNAGVWASLPPLERLGIEYSLGESFSLPAITAWLSSGREFAETLHTLDFHRQLRSFGGIRELADLLAVAKNLRRLSVSFTWGPKDTPDTSGVILRSSTLESMRFVVSYMRVHSGGVGFGGEEEFEETILRSLKTPDALPKLKMLTVGGGEGKFEELRELKDIAVVVEEFEKEGPKRVAGLKRGPVKVGRCEIGEAAENAEPQIVEGEEEEVKEGLDLAEELWDEHGDLVELWCA